MRTGRSATRSHACLLKLALSPPRASHSTALANTIVVPASAIHASAHAPAAVGTSFLLTMALTESAAAFSAASKGASSAMEQEGDGRAINSGAPEPGGALRRRPPPSTPPVPNKQRVPLT